MTMKLPQLSTPTYTLKLPSTGKQIGYRPFLVKEEKILLLALESEDNKTIARALEQIVLNCTDDAVDVKTLPLFDLEYIFLQIRSKSAGENAEPVLNLTDETGTSHEIKLKIPISSIPVVRDEKHTNEIKLTEDIYLKMKYPTFGMSEDYADANPESSSIAFDLIVSCIEEIFQGENSWKATDLSKEEMVAFVEDMTQEQFVAVSDFFNTMPKLEKELEVPVGKKKHKITLSGLQDFFGSPSVTLQ
tara:strand:- start:6065 stop:6802 length:738 start_codon:yes stop_codon:yes gene_type:complete